MTAKASKKAAEPAKKAAKSDKDSKHAVAAKTGKPDKHDKHDKHDKPAAKVDKHEKPAAKVDKHEKSAKADKHDKPAKPDHSADKEVEREGGLKKKELKRFREILLEKKEEILQNAKRTLSEDMTLDADDLADEMDLASSEYLQSFTLRLRGREKTFLKKIDHALLKIDDGTFGMCEDCGELISIKRLEARPETTLCIRCKEDQERMEKAYG